MTRFSTDHYPIGSRVRHNFHGVLGTIVAHEDDKIVVALDDDEGTYTTHPVNWKVIGVIR